jgi:hypothetical protein
MPDESGSGHLDESDLARAEVATQIALGHWAQEDKSERRKLLEDTVNLIDGERNADYGEPIDDFSQTALFIQAYLDGTTRVRGKLIILPHDVAIIQDFVKTSRIITSPGKRDHWADKTGYSGCGWDTVVASGLATS